jgi:branched-subunit amino acid ABC-type transport system permease component
VVAEPSALAEMRRISTFFLIAAFVIFIGAFFLAVRTPIGRSLRGCRQNVPCDQLPDSSHRQAVFFLGMGLATVVLTGGIVLRLVGSQAST